MATASNRYAETFNQFASGTANRKERAREFVSDRLTALYERHMDSRDQAEALINLGAGIAAAPTAAKTIKTGVTKLETRLGQIRAGTRAASVTQAPAAATNQTIATSQSSGSSTRPITVTDDEFGAQTSAQSTTTGDAVSFGGEAARGVETAGQTATSASDAVATGARSLISNTGRLAVRTGANIASYAGRAGETVGTASRAAGRAISSAAEAASNAASGAAEAVGGAARAVVGDAAVDAIGAGITAVSELAGPVSVLALLGVGIWDIWKASHKPKLDSKPAPVNTQKAAVVAPSFDSTEQQTSVAGAF